MKNSYKKVKIDPADYVNIKTGEPLNKEVGNITSVNVKSNDLHIIDSKEYLIIDSNALDYIQRNFTQVEVARITKMADMVKGIYNILLNKNDDPHTNATLMEELQYTRNIFAEFMKKLFNKSVISHFVTLLDDKKVTYIILNPTLARKGKMFHNDCLKLFKDLSKH